MTKPDGTATAPLRPALAVPKKTAWAWALATVLGTGFLRPGPGTWGSAVAVLVWLATAYAKTLPLATLHWMTLAAAVVITGAGVPAASIVQRESGRDDPGFVVLDEVAGQWTALILARPHWTDWLLAFLLFRAFDILKPPPARQIDRTHTGTGIMMDDVAAGLYAMLVLWLLQRWI